MIEQTKNTINNVITQASKGTVSINCDFGAPLRFFTKFNTSVEGTLLNPPVETSDELSVEAPVLNISNADTFASLTQKYLLIAKNFYSEDKNYWEIDDKGFEELLFMSLISNATNYDLNNPEQFIVEKTKMLTSPIETGIHKISFGNHFLVISIEKTQCTLEAPYKFKPQIIDDLGNRFTLPEITFALSNNTANVYAIQRMLTKEQKQQTDKKPEKNACEKYFDRYFRKLNNGVNKDDEIYNISPNALVSLTLFMSCLEKNNISKIEAPLFLPVRYATGTNLDIIKCKTPEEQRNAIEKRNSIQMNITNKFQNTFARFCHHFKSANIAYDETQEKVLITLTKKLHQSKQDDNIIYDICSMIPANFEIIKQSEEFSK